MKEQKNNVTVIFPNSVLATLVVTYINLHLNEPCSRVGGKGMISQK